jgi:hypothetical protein
LVWARDGAREVEREVGKSLPPRCRARCTRKRGPHWSALLAQRSHTLLSTGGALPPLAALDWAKGRPLLGTEQAFRVAAPSLSPCSSLFHPPPTILDHTCLFSPNRSWPNFPSPSLVVLDPYAGASSLSIRSFHPTNPNILLFPLKAQQPTASLQTTTLPRLDSTPALDSRGVFPARSHASRLVAPGRHDTHIYTCSKTTAGL